MRRKVIDVTTSSCVLHDGLHQLQKVVTGMEQGDVPNAIIVVPDLIVRISVGSQVSFTACSATLLPQEASTPKRIKSVKSPEKWYKKFERKRRR